MHFSNSISLLAAVAAPALAQSTISVAVGQNGLTYTPSDIKASVGDKVEFSFFPKNHTVTQSSFANPCHPLDGGFFSTFQPTAVGPSNQTFTITVNDTKPIWIYCGQTTGGHCQAGMVAAINAPATGNTLAAFTALAKNATTSSSPPSTGPIGGVLAIKGSNSTSSSETTVTTSVTKTVTATVTTGGSSYTTTYATTYGTTYTTGASAATTGGSGSGSGSGSSSTSSGLAQATGNSASGLKVGGSLVGAMAAAALAVL